MRPLIILSLAAALGLGAAALPAAASPVDQAFGNTIISTYPDGRTARLWLHADGSYSAKGRRGDPSSGRWSIKGAKVCLKQQKPFGAPFTYCTPFGAAKVGASWQGKAVTGERITIRMVKGQG
ncbi:MAG: hypothetical protein JWP35_1729 [Caulobacter sp.]|nr:hypothetical protein [Caulobacter sp.]